MKGDTGLHQDFIPQPTPNSDQGRAFFRLVYRDWEFRCCSIFGMSLVILIVAASQRAQYSVFKEYIIVLNMKAQLV